MARVQTHRTVPAAPPDSIQVVVDLNRCQGYAQCCFLAPSVFKLHGQVEAEPEQAIAIMLSCSLIPTVVVVALPFIYQA